jgi:hypothetical protein
MADEHNRMHDLAERIYARRSALEAARARRQLPIGVHQLVEFLGKPDAVLTWEQQRTLFADRRLIADFRRLKAMQQVAAMPQLAAASDGQLKERRVDGGSIRLHPSRIANQYYVVIRFGSPAQYPRALVLESEAGEILKRALPQPDANGELMFICDVRNDADARLVALISDPATVGSFLA